MESFIKLCKSNNLKITPQRSLIYKELVASKDHPNAEIMYKKVKKTFPAISFDTVYRTLLTFSKIGIADILALPGEPKRFDGNKKGHYHFRCIKCDNIIDINDSSNIIKIPDSISQKFDILDSKIIFEGICDKCKKVN
ncbi:MAG: transcriptional repressor [Actinomycetota bacterium]|nr:transcriptional repressor [Actinomycetota bacterium]